MTNALSDLRQAANEVRHAEQTLESITARRDRLIREANASGVSYRQIASVAGLSFGRIAQIVKRER